MTPARGRWMGSRRAAPSPPTGAETELEDQIRVTKAVLAAAIKKTDTSNAVRAQTLLARLTADLERRRAARVAGDIRDPVKRFQALRKLAESDGSWVAATTFAKLEAEAAAEAERKRQERKRARPLSPEERLKVLPDLVQRASDDELEVCIVEWLKRRRYRLEVDDRGTLQVVPFGEEGPSRAADAGDE